ncbi:MAG: hypothetical protein SV377_04060 [Halobacteria archaeon]|nr:hypothetical protein [Halobacteria archaeon]
MVVDTVITGGTLVTSEGMVEASLAIDDGTIVGVGKDPGMPESDETVDA